MSWKDIKKLLSMYRLYNYHFSMPACAGMFEPTRMCMWNSEVDVGCLQTVFYLIFRDSFSHWTWSVPVLLGWLGRKSQGHFCLYLSSVGLTIVTWVPGGGGGWTQVLMTTWQVLDQLNCLSNPSHTTHIRHMHARVCVCVNICMCVYLCVCWNNISI